MGGLGFPLPGGLGGEFPDFVPPVTQGTVDLKLALQIDANNPIVGDLFLDPTGQIVLTQQLAEAVAQLLYIRFRFFKGEWFLDTRQGVPWLQTILGQKLPLGIAGQIFKRIITTTPGVSSLLAFQINRIAGRGVQPIFAAKLADGTVLTSKDFGDFLVPTPGASQ